MFSLLRKIRPVKSSANTCPKCGISEDTDEIEHQYMYGKFVRGRDYEDGYKRYACGWYCTECDRCDWLIPDDNEWLATEDPNIVLPEVWKEHQTNLEAETKAAREKELSEFEAELKNTLVTVESAIKVFTDDNSYTVDDTMEAGKVLIEELNERKNYTIHILQKQVALIGLNNEDRRLLRCWGYEEVEYEDE